MVRKDEDDEVYRTAREKNEAIVEEIQAAHEKGQPMLVGTVSIEKSEHLSDLLKAQGPAPPGAQRPLPRAGGATSSRRPAASAR